MAARKGGKTALVLASGGLTGVAYEVGALRALDHILTNRTVNDFDIYVGTSAGAVVAASLANGMPPIMLAGLPAGTVPRVRPLSPLSLYRLHLGGAPPRPLGAPTPGPRAPHAFCPFPAPAAPTENLLPRAGAAPLMLPATPLAPRDPAATGAPAPTDEPRRSIFDLGIRAIGNQVLRGMLHDSLINHAKSLRQEHPEVDFILIEPRPDDEKMFFHEVMSFSAQMIVLQHGYETVISGLYQNWPYISRVLPRHGIEITRKLVESKPLEVSVKEMEKQGNMIGRLFQTVLDRRTTAGQRAEVMSTVDTQPASERRGPAPGPAADTPRACERAA